MRKIQDQNVSDDLVNASNKTNNIGFLRLLFATVVILSHVPEIIYGDRSREVLTMIFGTNSFGELGVNGFFLISGYLITKSFLRGTSLRVYFLHRVKRIIPGYVAAYIVSLCVVGPLVGGHLASLAGPDGIKALARPLLLLAPALEGAFSGRPHPELNGSMWTIAYEFRCYIVVALLGIAGGLRRRQIALWLTAALIIFWLIYPYPTATFPRALCLMIGDFRDDLRLFTVFFVGSCFFLFEDKIRYSGRAAFVATVLLLPLMATYRFTGPAIAILGGYIMFWFAFRVKIGLAGSGRGTNISYGVYLYAWPIASSIAWIWPDISPWVLFPITVCMSFVAGYMSWTLVERPFVRQTA